MAFWITPYQICVNKMNIYSGEFFLGNAHCLNPDSQDLGIFPINSEKKRQILHNFANILTKNTKTPLKSTLAPIKNIGGWAKNIGIIVRTPMLPIIGLTRLQPTLLQQFHINPQQGESQ
jgi:hypothetical protein